MIVVWSFFFNKYFIANSFIITPMKGFFGLERIRLIVLHCIKVLFSKDLAILL